MLEKTWKVSIIIPVYNAEYSLHRSIDSVINQTYQNWEMILVDDGSNDKSVEICEEYCAIDSRIKLVKGTHAGASSARNLGITNAQGQFFMFVDSDDCITPQAIANMMAEMVIGDIDLCVSGYEYYDILNDIHIKNHLAYFRGTKKQYISDRYLCSLENSIAYTQCSKLYKRSLIEKYGIMFKEKYSICEDALFVNMYLSKCEKICVLDNTDYIYYSDQKDSLSKVHQYGEYLANSELYSDITNMVKQTKVHQDIVDRITNLFFMRYVNFSMRILWDGDWKYQKRELLEMFSDDVFCDVINSSKITRVQYKLIQLLMKRKMATVYLIIIKMWNARR